MNRIRRTENGQTLFWCPGCEQVHAVNDSWSITGTPDSPTIAPSVLVWPSGNIKRCHSFVREGSIEYLSDSDHELAGKTVPLPDLDSIPPTASSGISPRPDRKTELLAHLGAILDDIDSQVRKPGEPSLREVFAEHAREQLAALRGDTPSPTNPETTQKPPSDVRTSAVRGGADG